MPSFVNAGMSVDFRESKGDAEHHAIRKSAFEKYISRSTFLMQCLFSSENINRVKHCQNQELGKGFINQISFLTLENSVREYWLHVDKLPKWQLITRRSDIADFDVIYTSRNMINHRSLKIYHRELLWH